MKKLILLILSMCYVLLIVSVIIPQAHAQDDSPDPSAKVIVISHEQFLAIQNLVQSKEAQLNRAVADEAYWAGAYEKLKACVRKAAKKSIPATTCLGDISL